MLQSFPSIDRFYSSKTLQNQNGTAMLFILVIAVIGSIVMSSVFFTSRYSLKKSGNRVRKVSVVNIAEAGVQSFYGKLVHDTTIHLATNDTQLIFDTTVLGSGAYKVQCMTGGSTDTFMVLANGFEGDKCIELEITAALVPKLPFDITGKVRGAITARQYVELSGTIDIDGREYDSLDNYVGPGTYGVYTCDGLNLKGNAQIAGNGDPLSKTKNSLNCVEYATPETYMTSPEAFIGVPSGSLDGFKVSVSSLNGPFSGINYIDGASGTVKVDFGKKGEVSSGILIVHNSSYSLCLKMNGNAYFKGLIICDGLDKLDGNAAILGAVVVLGVSDKSNGTASVRYSPQVLNSLKDTWRQIIKSKIQEMSWKERSCS